MINGIPGTPNKSKQLLSADTNHPNHSYSMFTAPLVVSS